jgi:hypothetical protein
MCIVVLALAAARKNPLFRRLSGKRADSLYNEIIGGETSGSNKTTINIDELPLGNLKEPIVLDGGIAITGVSADESRRTLLVDIRATPTVDARNKNRTDRAAGNTCELIFAARCSQEIFHFFKVFHYNTRCCAGEYAHSDCTRWAVATAKRKTLHKDDEIMFTGWCGHSIIPFPRSLTMELYRNNARVEFSTHSVDVLKAHGISLQFRCR